MNRFDEMDVLIDEINSTVENLQESNKKIQDEISAFQDGNACPDYDMQKELNGIETEIEQPEKEISETGIFRKDKLYKIINCIITLVMLIFTLSFIVFSLIAWCSKRGDWKEKADMVGYLLTLFSLDTTICCDTYDFFQLKLKNKNSGNIFWKVSMIPYILAIALLMIQVIIHLCLSVNTEITNLTAALTIFIHLIALCIIKNKSSV